MTFAVDLPSGRFDSVFGQQLEPRDAGRSRLCKTCGGWHSLDRPWPHNCREPDDTPAQILPSPMLAPGFEPFRTSPLPEAEIINSRNEKREYMNKNGLTEFETGVTNDPTWAEKAENRREIAKVLHEFKETDTDYYGPELKAAPMNEGGSLATGTEIETSGIEVAE